MIQCTNTSKLLVVIGITKYSAKRLMYFNQIFTNLDRRPYSLIVFGQKLAILAISEP